MGAESVVAWEVTPTGLDTVAQDLRALRAAAGDPSYAAIGRTIAEHRAARGVPAHEQRVARTTVYNCFQDGRRRIDAEAVTEVAVALGLPESDRGRWGERLRLARAAGDGASVAAVRDGVPPPVPYFAGRDAEVAQLTAVLSRGGRVWISGMAGAGKTQLALTLADRLGRDALFLDLRGNRAESPPVEAVAGQRAILRRLEQPEGGTAAQRATRIRKALAGQSRLLVLDDAAHPEQVAAIIGARGSVPVLVTSRRPLPGDAAGWTHLALAGLDASETAAMLQASPARPRRRPRTKRAGWPSSPVACRWRSRWLAAG